MGLAKTFLAVGIAVIFAVFVSYALHVIYEPPKEYSSISNDCYKTYNCQQQVNTCRQQYNYSDEGYQDCYSTVTQSAEYKTCQELYSKCVEDSTKKTPRYIHSRNSFYILIIIGIIAIVVGLLLTKFEGIGSGIMGGGVLIVLWSLAYTWQYWYTLNKYIKLVALGIVLIILIFLGYKKLESRLKQ